ncbi:hypothetical protein GCM10010495_11310 [Kitasatospora herbaricolor]|uniref:hypothetical protein n=1 Tax=Kitasatospora herbaricolor TaxID=68217 RepID=UPI00174D7C95|nr:hypothetical protein [Kitasatospora herbaricolor]MDQ0309432.1 hypothetical protein [Kitasatospora herbaricolor]GGV01849.1 hypothetical protein GCM10010495_11310 [Kitasatospora herbaricolor]
MSKKHPRSLDGGDDGQGGTPMERLLRDALEARAGQISAHDLRPAAPPSRRVRRLRPVYVAAVPLFGLAAALAFSVLGFRGDNAAQRHDAPPAATVSGSPAPTVSEGPGPSPSPSASATTASPLTPPDGPASSTSTTPGSGAAVPYNFRGVKFKVPAGWTVPTQSGNRLCVLSPGAPADATADSCEPYGVSLTVYNTAEEIERAIWPSMADLDSDSGWGTQPYCPVWGNPHDIGSGDTLKTVGKVVRTRDIVASKTISKTQWQVSCNSKENFTAQLWGLADDQVYIAAIGLKPEYQADLVSILDTLDLSSRPAPAAKAHQNDVAVTVEGLNPGQSVPNDGTMLQVSVTYRNTSQTNYPAVHPLLFAEWYAGSPGEMVSITAGSLERLDGTAWKPLGLGVGGGMDYATQGKDAAFPLAPGQSRTVKYRMKLTREDGAGVLPVTAQAVLPYDGSGDLTLLGHKSTPVRVVVK